VPFDQENLRVQLGDFLMMENGQPLPFDRAAASNYMKQAAAGAYLKGDTVLVSVTVGNGPGSGRAWGCDLSYDYVKINAEYTT
jgi:glutamate N-acetyltransferase/amino-acid N-acetyltransferase